MIIKNKIKSETVFCKIQSNLNALSWPSVLHIRNPIMVQFKKCHLSEKLVMSNISQTVYLAVKRKVQVHIYNIDVVDKTHFK